MLVNKVLKIIPAKRFSKGIHTSPQALWDIPKYVEFDKNYLCNPKNISRIENNISKRKGIGDIRLVNELYLKLTSLAPTDPSYESLKTQFYQECVMIPNNTHCDVYEYGDDPKLIKYVGQKKKFDVAHKEFFEITKRLNLVRTEQLGNLSGSKSYYLLGEMAELEQALVHYFIHNLLKHNFQLVSVPDILPRGIVESCGMNTRGERTQVSSTHQV